MSFKKIEDKKYELDRRMKKRLDKYDSELKEYIKEQSFTGEELFRAIYRQGSDSRKKFIEEKGIYEYLTKLLSDILKRRE